MNIRNSHICELQKKYETVIFCLISLLLLKLISQRLLLLTLTFDINFLFPTQILTVRLKNGMAQALTVIGKYRCGRSLNTWMTTFLSFLQIHRHRTLISTFCILIKLLSCPPKPLNSCPDINITWHCVYNQYAGNRNVHNL